MIGDMMTLNEFLTARLDEDEAVARSARSDDDPSVWLLGIDQGSSLTPGDAIAVHPARVLAEVEAKRRLLALHNFAQWDVPPGDDYPDGIRRACVTCGNFDERPTIDWPCLTVRHLALPYADHPDWREEWRP